MEGQLYPIERQLLFDTVLRAKPKVVLEIGTWKGGGSTYQIATALRQLGSGKLYTCEVDRAFFEEARGIYTNNWENIVECHYMASTDMINYLLSNNIIPDFVFNDGPEDPELNLNDFLLIAPHLLQGAVFGMHDWDTDIRVDGLVSVKAKLLRPYLENSPEWRIEAYLTRPESVGMVMATKL